MPGLFDQALTSGGWNTAQNPGNYTAWDSANGVGQATSTYGDFWRDTGKGAMAFARSRGYTGPDTHTFNYETGNFEEDPAATQAFQQWQQASGNQFAVNQSAQQGGWLGPNGQPIAGSTFSIQPEDNTFWTGALLAGGVLGAGAGGYLDLGAGTLGTAAGGAGAAGGTSGLVDGAFLVDGAGATGVSAMGGTASGFAPAAGATAGGAGGGGGSLSSLLSGTAGARDWASIISGIYGMSLADDAQERSDPFGPYRGQYAAQMQALEANPGLITSRPGYNAGLEAVQRQVQSKGYLGSGNHSAALMEYSGGFFDKEMTRLGNLAGANIQPGNSAYSSANLVGQSLASIGYGLAPYLKSGGTSGGSSGGGSAQWFQNSNAGYEAPFLNQGG